jgi:hypothetical protein
MQLPNRNERTEGASCSSVADYPSRRFLERMLLISVVLIAGATCAEGQTPDALPPISTDRPGQATPPSILVPGAVQIEAGVQLSSDATSSGQVETTVRTLSAPTALVRIGLLPSMELRLSTEFRSVGTRAAPGTFDTTISGVSGVGIGTKIGVTAEEGAIPETAFLLSIALPFGSEAFRVSNVAPTFLFAMRSGLSSTTNIYYNLGATWDGTNGAGYGLYNVLLSTAPTAEIGVFAEVYGTLATGLRPVHAADLGIAYLLGNNLQLDLYGGVGITDNASDYFVAGGVSMRLPR